MIPSKTQSNMKKKKIKSQLLYNLLVIIGVVLLDGCMGNSKIDPIENPYIASYFRNNSPLNYVHLNSNSLFICTEGTSLSYPSIIEVPYKNIDKQKLKDVRYYNFDIDIENQEISKRANKKLSPYRCDYRNIRQFFIPMKIDTFPDLNGLSKFNRKNYTQMVDNNIKKGLRIKYTYFIFNSKSKEMLFINPYDGFDDSEKKILTWIRKIVLNLSPLDLRYYDLVNSNPKDMQYYLESNKETYSLKLEDIYN
jgi:hypothetical protein